MYDWSLMAATLAHEEPWWEPDSRHGYHVNTFGFLVGEIVRRVSGESIGAFVRREIAGNLGNLNDVLEGGLGDTAAEPGEVAQPSLPTAPNLSRHLWR